MTLQIRNLFFGLIGMTVLTVCGIDAQMMAGSVQSKLRFPVTPLQVIGAPQSTVEDELHQMSTQAGVIFVGQVISVRRQDDAGWIEIAFHVEQGVRGCAGQSTYHLREWAGLWAGGKERYKVGQRLLMMLHTPSASGLSSPVGGQDGAIPITGLGAAPKPGDTFIGAGEQAVDLRWLQARVLRPAGNSDGYAGAAKSIESVSSLSNGGLQRAQITRVSSSRSELVEGSLTGNLKSADATSTNEAPLRNVLAMLGAWEAQQADAAR